MTFFWLVKEISLNQYIARAGFKSASGNVGAACAVDVIVDILDIRTVLIGIDRAFAVVNEGTAGNFSTLRHKIAARPVIVSENAVFHRYVDGRSAHRSVYPKGGGGNLGWFGQPVVFKYAVLDQNILAAAEP